MPRSKNAKIFGWVLAYLAVSSPAAFAKESTNPFLKPSVRSVSQSLNLSKDTCYPENFKPYIPSGDDSPLIEAAFDADLVYKGVINGKEIYFDVVKKTYSYKDLEKESK